MSTRSTSASALSCAWRICSSARATSLRAPTRSTTTSRCCTLFEILEVAGRADLKSDLLQELERQKQVLLSFRNNPEISEEALTGVLRDIEQAAAALFSMTGRIGQYLRENEWLMSIKQRTGIPGRRLRVRPALLPLLAAPPGRGAHRPARRAGPARSIRCATAPRSSCASCASRASRRACRRRWARSSRCSGGKTAQMLRVRLEPGLPCVPEISANKYVLNIRFLAQNGEETRAKTADWDVGFELTFCNL